VELYRPVILEGRRNNIIGAGAQSDETGELHIFGIAPGSYYIAVNAQGHSVRKSHPYTYQPILYPAGRDDFSTVQLFELRPGAEEHVKMNSARSRLRRYTQNGSPATDPG
jgi:hypothetical protein